MSNEKNNGSSSNNNSMAIIIALIGGACTILAAIITLFTPLFSRFTDRLFVEPTAVVAVTTPGVTVVVVTPTPPQQTNTPGPLPTRTLSQSQQIATMLAKTAAAATETPNAAGTAAARACVLDPVAPTDWVINICDQFNDSTRDWDLGDTDDEFTKGTRSVENGKFMWRYTARKGFVTRAQPGTVYLHDFYLTVRAEIAGGPDTTAYGIEFRDKDDNYYLFLAWETGRFTVNKYAGTWTQLLEGTNPTALHPGANKLVMEAQGDKFGFWANDIYLGGVEDAAFAIGEVGLAIQMDEGAEGTVDFDEFAVLTSTGSSSQRPPIDVSPLPTIAPTATQE